MPASRLIGIFTAVGSTSTAGAAPDIYSPDNCVARKNMAVLLIDRGCDAESERR